MQIIDSALKHGYSVSEIENIITQCPFRIRLKSSQGECFAYWGPDRNGNMLEVFMDCETETVFHAMKLSKTIENHIRRGGK